MAVTRAVLAEAAYRNAREVLRDEATDLVDQVLATIADALVAGEEVKISGFGKFVAKTSPARVARNPKRPSDLYEVPALARVRFYAAEGLRELVARRSASGQRATPAPRSGIGSAPCASPASYR